jgi:glycerophosphoryl diester phosphodiesterase
MNEHAIMVIGHRGAAGEAPENTLTSFQLAVEQGADAIELDIHLSKDGEIIVCHDASIERTTNGLGLIKNLTAAEIKRFDAGAWFSPRFSGQTIPLLTEVLDLVPEHIWINIEIKSDYQGQTVLKLVELLRIRKRLDKIVISSFDHDCLKRLKTLEPRTKIGLLYGNAISNPVAYVKSLGVEVYSLHPSFKLIQRMNMQQIQAAGLQIYPYTINKEKDYSSMIQSGVSGIITDFPAKLVKFLHLNS